MLKPQGRTVVLLNKEKVGEDPLGQPIYDTVLESVKNVLIAPSSSQEILDATNLYGKKAIYTLAIPKGDTHEWENRKVLFFGKTWHTFGIPLEGQEELIPGAWNKKVTVERYE